MVKMYSEFIFILSISEVKDNDNRSYVTAVGQRPALVSHSGVPMNFVRGGGFQQFQLRTEDRENGDLGDGSPLVRGSGGSCNFVQEISFHIVKFS